MKVDPAAWTRTCDLIRDMISKNIIYKIIEIDDNKIL